MVISGWSLWSNNLITLSAIITYYYLSLLAWIILLELNHSFQINHVTSTNSNLAVFLFFSWTDKDIILGHDDESINALISLIKLLGPFSSFKVIFIFPILLLLNFSNQKISIKLKSIWFHFLHWLLLKFQKN